MEIAGTRTPRAARGLRANFRKYWPYYVMALPGVVYLIIFKFVPMLGCVIAFAWVDEAQAAHEDFVVRTARNELAARRVELPFYKEGTARKKLQ